jgi:hypothetical protein
MIFKKFTYGDWELEVTSDNSISVYNSGEFREYTLDKIVEAKQSDELYEYVYFEHENETFTQVKFEIDNFLVIDLFDKDGEFLEEIGSHVFGED